MKTSFTFCTCTKKKTDTHRCINSHAHRIFIKNCQILYVSYPLWFFFNILTNSEILTWNKWGQDYCLIYWCILLIEGTTAAFVTGRPQTEIATGLLGKHRNNILVIFFSGAGGQGKIQEYWLQKNSLAWLSVAAEGAAIIWCYFVKVLSVATSIFVK